MMERISDNTARACVRSVDIFACHIRHVMGKPEICYEIHCILEDGTDLFLSRTYDECISLSTSWNSNVDQVPLDAIVSGLGSSGWFLLPSRLGKQFKSISRGALQHHKATRLQSIGKVEAQNVFNGDLSALPGTLKESIETSKIQMQHFLNRHLCKKKSGIVEKQLQFLEIRERLDWPPSSGKISELHDLPHIDSNVFESWNVTAHFELNGNRVTVFASFVAIYLEYDEDLQRRAQALAATVGIINIDKEEYHTDTVLDPSAKRYINEILASSKKQGKLLLDPRIQKALEESIIKDDASIPLPDRLSKSMRFETSNLLLHLDNVMLQKDDKKFRVKFSMPKRKWNLTTETMAEPELKVSLKFDAIQTAIDGENYIRLENNVRQSDDSDISIFHYAAPNIAISGKVDFGEGSQNIQARGWYDHAFGGPLLETPPKAIYRKTSSMAAAPATSYSGTLDYYGLDLDEYDIGNVQIESTESLYSLFKKASLYSTLQIQVCLNDDKWIYLSISYDRSMKVEGIRSKFLKIAGEADTDDIEFTLTETKKWISKQTFLEYPVEFALSVPSKDLNISISVVFEAQEHISLLFLPSCYHGRINAVGKINGRSVSGLGMMHMSGFNKMTGLSSIFSNVGKEVVSAVSRVLPNAIVDTDHGVEMIASEDFSSYLKALDMSKYVETVLEPIRSITDRGGKSWRSFVALGCYFAVGGNVKKDFTPDLAFSEMVHSGSLIVDDVEDESDLRRGGPCVHKVYGVPTAINAGCAAWFLTDRLMLSFFDKEDPKWASHTLHVFEMFFLTLRAGHAGQGLDIAGLDYLVDSCIASGNSETLEQAVIQTHCLKTALPAAVLAEMGAYAGGGSKAQLKIIREYFMEVGIAFQILDDVLNLRGVSASERKSGKMSAVNKTLGEDITAGKITMPIAVAFGRIPTINERQKLYNIVKSKPTEPHKVRECIDMLDTYGAIDECERMLEQRLETAWKEFDAEVVDSFYKIMLRACTFYVLRMDHTSHLLGH